MKRTEIYKKTYSIQPSPNPEDRGEESICDDDTLIDELESICITQEQEFEPNKIAQDPNFSYHDEHSFIAIKVEGSKFDKKYERRVCLQIMPAKAKIPKELSDMLASKGYRKIK
jgi:hypothetical protein